MSRSVKAAAEFEITPQEAVANRMFGLRRDTASRDDFDFLKDHFPGWSIDPIASGDELRTGFEKGARAVAIDTKLLVISRKICNAEGINIEPTSDSIRLSLPGEVSPVGLARVAMVDFSINPPLLLPQERYERMANIIGAIDRNKITKSGQPADETIVKPATFDFLENCKLSNEWLKKISLLAPSQVDLLSDIHLTTKKIAQKHKIEESSVRSRLKGICTKVGTSNLRDLILMSIGSGMSNITDEEIKAYKIEEEINFSELQTDVFNHMLEGKDYEVIGADLGLTRYMVAKELSAIYRILGVSNRTDCVLTALFNGIDISPKEL